MKNNIQLITDDAADLSKEQYLKNDIQVISFSVIDDNNTEITNTEDLYNSMLAEPKLRYKSACPSVDSFYNAFESSIKDNKAVICVTISAQFSGSFNSATVAKNMILEKTPNAEIYIIDSLMNSVEQGLFVLSIAQLINGGISAKDIVEKAMQNRETARIFFTTGTLDYLRSGGRIGLLKSVVANTLHLKPIIIMQNGAISSGGLGLGVKKTLTKIIDLVKTHFKKIQGFVKDYVFAIGFGNDKQLGETFQEQCMNNLEIFKDDIWLGHIGSTTAVHTGPYSIGIAFLKKMKI